MRQRWLEPETSTRGFTIIELLVTLFVAAIFLIASYQLYIVVLRADGQTKTQVIAQNTAQDYLERYRTSVPSPCVASTPLTNSPITVAGLVNVKLSVNVSCPKAGAIATLSKIDVTLRYGSQSLQQQIAYSAWSYSPDVCGAGYILVPGDSRFDTPAFCVMKYEAKNVNGAATSQAAGTPWVNISQNDAIGTAAAACPTCHLMSEAEWMTVAANTLSVASNWSGGAAGSGSMYIGHTDATPSNTLVASIDDNNGYYGTGNSASSGANQRRTLTLNNGEVMWDLAGNVWEWTNATVDAGQSPGLSGDWGNSNKEWTNGSLIWNGLPATSRPGAISAQAANWNSAQGIGQMCSNYSATSTMGYLRGASYLDAVTPPTAGVLSLFLCLPPTTPLGNVGFRVAKSIDSQPEQLAQPSSCPTGFIPVPGDARFGTIGFCVMKYEAKIQGNDNGNQTYSSSFVPESRASGTPWVNISQTIALAEAPTTVGCSGSPPCHLITEPEWMTIVANVLSVPSNWSGGAVGSGYVYPGHVDGAPFNSLAADTNDANGYYGETNTGGNQRRTLTLSNGQVIWDLADDVWEWTQGVISGNEQPGIPGMNSYAWLEWNNGSVVWNGLPVSGLPGYINPAGSGWSSAQSIGRIWSYYYETAAHGIMRGGYFGDGSNGGILAVSLLRTPSWSDGGIGFRVAR